MILVQAPTQNDYFEMCGIINRTPILQSKRQYPFPLKKQTDIDELRLTRKTYVAKDDHQVYGVMAIQTKNTYALCINELRVSMEYQRLGIGTMLLHKAEEFAITGKCLIAAAEVYNKNNKAIHFFQDNGYIVINDYLKQYPFDYLQGKYSLHNKLLMAKEL